MKKIIPMLLLALIAMQAAAQNKSIKFEEGTFASVVEKARKAKKPIFMDAYTTWCGPCKWMSQNVFTKDEVADFYNKNYICYKADMEKGEGIELAKRFEVRGYPTLLFFDNKGNLVHRAMGASQPAAFVQLGKDALNPDLQLVTLQKKYKEGKRDPQFLRRYIHAEGMVGTDVTPMLEEYLSKQKDSELATRENWDLMRNFLYNSESPAFQRVLQNRAALDKAFTKDSVNMYLTQVYTMELQRAGASGDEAKFRKAKEKLAGLTAVQDEQSQAMTLFSEVEFYKQKGDIKSYSENAVKLVDTYLSNNADALNNFAWEFYELVEDKAMLQKADVWSKKAVEIKPNYATLDTRAAVLYKLGRKREATQAAEQAIAAGKKEGEDVSSTEELLKKIKSM